MAVEVLEEDINRSGSTSAEGDADIEAGRVSEYIRAKDLVCSIIE